ncbi:hypothetical protein PYCCODRAFT_844994 [Trametes coccinea BRFM310]|uniref:Uncharacterized protein n=1 Tax=Trametes coccinea (strain BRFM310) TaxID=1353009 RepID=A0A1Y2IFC2_TRAC3|nr:hypothetical protein PYCCODRAFT_844994 [Trametes coccinea BRFM310]
MSRFIPHSMEAMQSRAAIKANPSHPSSVFLLPAVPLHVLVGDLSTVSALLSGRYQISYHQKPAEAPRQSALSCLRYPKPGASLFHSLHVPGNAQIGYQHAHCVLPIPGAVLTRCWAWRGITMANIRTGSCAYCPRDDAYSRAASPDDLIASCRQQHGLSVSWRYPASPPDLGAPYAGTSDPKLL